MKTLRISEAILFMLCLASLAGPGEASAGIQPGCDPDALAAAKATFRTLLELRRRSSEAVPLDEFRAASNRYIVIAEACYQHYYGAAPVPGITIDEDGLWADGMAGAPLHRAAARAGRRGGPEHPDFYNLQGTKWGSGSPFLTAGDNVDAAGPGISGGVVTYSFMPSLVDLSAEVSAGLSTDSQSTALTDLPGFDPCFLTEIEAAFAAWSAVADIEFQPSQDNGVAFNGSGALGDIRIGAHGFDGVFGVLAHAYFPPPNGVSAAGDLHFDSDENWVCDPAVITGTELDIGIVALHELGHSIGLRHESSDPAVMEPYYNAAMSLGPLADDVHGATQIYGPNPSRRSFFSDIGIGTENPAARFHIENVLDNDTDDFVVTSAGKVGVGLVNPANGVHVKGDAPGFIFEESDWGNQKWQMAALNGEWRLRDLSAGNVYPFRVAPGFAVTGMSLASNGNVGIGTTSPTARLHVVGSVFATGGVSSSRTLKEEIVPLSIEAATETLRKLEPVSFVFKDDPARDRQLGFIAEDVPELVSTPGRQGIQPMDLIAVLVRTVQAQGAEIEVLRAQLAEVESRLNGKGEADRTDSRD
jgi:hypothetical protein